MIDDDEEDEKDEKLVPIQRTTIFSQADNKIPITVNNWAVSIMRKPTSGNPEHAFLIVEGITNNHRGLIRRYDLVIDDERPKFVEIIDKEIRVKLKDLKNTFYKDFLKQSVFFCKTWSLSLNQAELLHKDIIADQSNDIMYFVSGDKSIMGSFSGIKGHSCFTWAREKLHNLNDKRIQLPEKFSDKIGAKTSFYITDPNKKKDSCIIL